MILIINVDTLFYKSYIKLYKNNNIMYNILVI